MRNLELRLSLAGALALGAGALVYLCLRDHSPVASAFAVCMGSLPTLLHTAAFALLSLAVVAPWPRLAPAVCGAWFIIESAFEALQIPTVAQLTHVIELAPGSLLLRAYLRGTFDPADIAAAATGALLAAWIAARTRAHDVELRAR